jgi:hypothetical protein
MRRRWRLVFDLLPAGRLYAQTPFAPVCLWFDHNAGSLGVEAG